MLLIFFTSSVREILPPKLYPFLHLNVHYIILPPTSLFLSSFENSKVKMSNVTLSLLIAINLMMIV